MIPDPQLAGKIALYRQKQAEGTMTIDDWKTCFLDLRQARASAQSASAASKKAAKKAPVNTEALKDSLRSLMVKKA